MTNRIDFVNPVYFSLLILLPLLAVFLVWTERQRRRALLRLGDQELMALLAAQVSQGRRWWKAALWLLCLLGLILSLVRPTWGVRTDLIETQGVSVFILLDVSNSMNAEDIAPSRLTRAKIGIQDLLYGIAGNEVGLVAFAGTAFVVFPLTTDARSAQSFLNYVSTESISRQGTAIGTAIQLSLDSFDYETPTERIIVLISDGEDHSEDAEAAIRAAIDAGVTIHVVGYGTLSGGSIPIRNSSGLVVGNKQDRAGNIVITTLNDALLREIADRTGGVYQRIDPDDRALQNLVQLINSADGGVLGEDEQTRGVERFGLFAFLALILLSVEMLLPEAKSV